MTNPPVVIDTCSFDDRGFIRWLRAYRGVKQIPPVVYCELAVVNVQRNGDTSRLDAMLRAADIETVEMLQDHGRRAAFLAKDDPNWKRNWRDYMIGAHAFNAPYRLVTLNVGHFLFLGTRTMTPADFRAGIESGTVR